MQRQIDYDTFGFVTSDTNSTLDVQFGFAGGLYDHETRLCLFGYRDYDTETGRWLAKDPIFFAGGDTNLYGYCVNDPVNFIDPEGLKLWYANKRSEKKLKPAIKDIMKTPVGRQLLSQLHNSSQTYLIHEGNGPLGQNYQYGNDVYVTPCSNPTIQTTGGHTGTLIGGGIPGR